MNKIFVYINFLILFKLKFCFSAKKSRKALESADKDGLPPAPKERTRRSRSRSKTPARQGPEGHKRAPVVVEPLKSQVKIFKKFLVNLYKL